MKKKATGRTIIIKTNLNGLTAGPFDLACAYQHRGLDRREAWNEFVKDRALRPEIDAKTFMSIFDSAGPVPGYTLEEIDFTPTHTDLLKDGMECQIVEDVEDGLFHIWWADGGHGSNPPSYPPEPERFIPIAAVFQMFDIVEITEGQDKSAIGTVVHTPERQDVQIIPPLDVNVYQVVFLKEKERVLRRVPAASLRLIYRPIRSEANGE